VTGVWTGVGTDATGQKIDTTERWNGRLPEPGRRMEVRRLAIHDDQKIIV
jgi:hypothetical protein